VARRADFATAARFPPRECGLGFLPLVPLSGFMVSFSLSYNGISTV
jgi:hypothetical protein